MTLSDQIRAAIRKGGWTTYSLAVASGVSRPQVCRFVNGTRELTLPAAGKLCKALGLELRPIRRGKAKGG